MVRRLISLLLLGWSLGFGWFAVSLPRPIDDQQTDAAVVLTGGTGRIERGMEVLARGWTRKILVSGVDRDVKPHEFAIGYRVKASRMACCVTLGYQATDTHSNATEAVQWLQRERVKTVRLVTNDWHMRRAQMELARVAPADLTIVPDAVPSEPSLSTLLREYNKLLARAVLGAFGVN